MLHPWASQGSSHSVDHTGSKQDDCPKQMLSTLPLCYTKQPGFGFEIARIVAIINHNSKQELATQKLQQDTEFVIQRKDSEIQHNASITSTELHDVIKHKDLKVENLQSELAQVKQKAVIDLERREPSTRGRCSTHGCILGSVSDQPVQHTTCCAKGTCSSGTACCRSSFPRTVIGRVCKHCLQPTIKRRRTSVSRTKQHHDYACEEENQNKDSTSA